MADADKNNNNLSFVILGDSTDQRRVMLPASIYNDEQLQPYTFKDIEKPYSFYQRFAHTPLMSWLKGHNKTNGSLLSLEGGGTAACLILYLITEYGILNSSAAPYFLAGIIVLGFLFLLHAALKGTITAKPPKDHDIETAQAQATKILDVLIESYYPGNEAVYPGNEAVDREIVRVHKAYCKLTGEEPPSSMTPAPELELEPSKERSSLEINTSASSEASHEETAPLLDRGDKKEQNKHNSSNFKLTEFELSKNLSSILYESDGTVPYTPHQRAAHQRGMTADPTAPRKRRTRRSSFSSGTTTRNELERKQAAAESRRTAMRISEEGVTQQLERMHSQLNNHQKFKRT